MTGYPFDETFKELVSAYDQRGLMWDFLIESEWTDTKDPFFDYLASAGYSAERVKENIDALKNMSLDSLVELVLNDSRDECSPALLWLQSQRSRNVFERAIQMTNSQNAAEREIAIEILVSNPGLEHRNAAVKQLEQMLESENELSVVAAIICAFAHFHLDGRSKLVHRFMDVSDQRIKEALAFCLGGESDDTAVGDLITLAGDDSNNVRGWATFALGSMIELDNDEIRTALYERLSDEVLTTRLEAMGGLAKRKDSRVKPFVISQLTSDEVPQSAVEAAGELGDSELYPYLSSLIRKSNSLEFLQCIDQALQTCCRRRSSDDSSGTAEW